MENANKDNVLIIFDDIFPSVYSPFRYEEYTEYIKYFENVFIFTTGKSLRAVGETRNLKEVIEEFEEKDYRYKGKVFELNDENIKKIKEYKNKISILTFLANVRENFKLLEKYEIPFIFTLYPGGGFVLNDEDCDLELRKICCSKYFKKVIVTQKNVYKYLLKKKIVKKEQIKFIFGVVTPEEILEQENEERKNYRVNKDNLDLCFVAHKYTEKGLDKGYDIFIDVAKRLSNKKYKDIYYHVIGGFDKSDIDVSELEGKIKFYGIKDSKWLRNFYNNMDIIVSPNRPFMLGKGTFDGFPTGSATEAMIRGVLLLCTDELKLNVKFKNRKDLIIIKPDINNVAKTIEKIYRNPNKITKIAKQGSKKAKEIYSKESQIVPRCKIIKDLFEKEG